ncbi:uncharacterized protein [Anabrus simplex]|uniref:uncharacterized protein n=1 Tax=Anabrus simplex TaxID=316456 RepID=UPI0035A2F852
MSPNEKRHEQTLHTIEMKMPRWTLGLTQCDHIRNEDVRQRLGVGPIVEAQRVPQGGPPGAQRRRPPAERVSLAPGQAKKGPTGFDHLLSSVQQGGQAGVLKKTVVKKSESKKKVTITTPTTAAAAAAAAGGAAAPPRPRAAAAAAAAGGGRRGMK